MKKGFRIPEAFSFKKLTPLSLSLQEERRKLICGGWGEIMLEPVGFK
jgi:hypothetical protein